MDQKSSQKQTILFMNSSTWTHYSWTVQEQFANCSKTDSKAEHNPKSAYCISNLHILRIAVITYSWLSQWSKLIIFIILFL